MCMCVRVYIFSTENTRQHMETGTFEALSLLPPFTAVATGTCALKFGHSNERGSLGLGIQPCPCRTGVLTQLGRSPGRALSPQTAPGAPVTSGAVGQRPPLQTSTEKHSRFPPCPPPLPSPAPQGGLPPTPAVLQIRSRRREGGEKRGFKELLLLLL